MVTKGAHVLEVGSMLPVPDEGLVAREVVANAVHVAAAAVDEVVGRAGWWRGPTDLVRCRYPPLPTVLVTPDHVLAIGLHSTRDPTSIYLTPYKT